MKTVVTTRRRHSTVVFVLTLSLAAPASFANPFAGDSYSFHHQLGALIDGVFKCFSVHMAGMNDNTVDFDGMTELLDIYTNGTQPFVFEFETAKAATTKGTDPTSSVEINSIAGDDLFPEGFEDPESGTPLTAACLEIGIDDTLDSDEPIDVTSAQLAFENDTDELGPFDITSSFSSPWDGRLSVVIPGLAGNNFRQIRLMIDTAPSNAELFSDGFETGNTSSWTDEVP